MKNSKMIKDVFTDIEDSGRRGHEASSVDRRDPGRSTSVRLSRRIQHRVEGREALHAHT